MNERDLPRSKPRTQKPVTRYQIEYANLMIGGVMQFRPFCGEDGVTPIHFTDLELASQVARGLAELASQMVTTLPNQRRLECNCQVLEVGGEILTERNRRRAAGLPTLPNYGPG